MDFLQAKDIEVAGFSVLEAIFFFGKFICAKLLCWTKVALLNGILKWHQIWFWIWIKHQELFIYSNALNPLFGWNFCA